MKNKILLPFFLICSSFTFHNLLTAQHFNSQTDCATEDVRERLFEQLPDLKNEHEQIEKLIQSRQHNQSNQFNNDIYTIPIVVHVIHRNGTPIGTDENLSDVEVINLVNQVNDYFRHASEENFPNPYAGVDVGIQFCLATRDPHGNPTSGIDRHTDDLLTVLGKDIYNKELQDKYHWNTTEYYNVYIVRRLSGVVGFAYFPSSHGRYWDGAVIQFNILAVAWVHEFGHAFGLYHTFQGADIEKMICPSNTDCTAQGDYVCDTPPHWENNCDLSINSCTNDEDDNSINNPFRPKAMGGLGDMTDPSHNYMSYACNRNFTQGQKIRMRTVAVNIRSSFLSSNVCTPLINNDVAVTETIISDTCKIPKIKAGMFLVNYGANNLTSATVQFLIDNIVLYTIDWTGNLSYGEYDSLAVPFVNTTFGTHNICIRVSNPNNSSDENILNNEICQSIFVDQYCASAGQYSSIFLEKVTIESIDNQSGRNNGYANFINLSTDLARGFPYTAQLTTGYLSTKRDSDWRIYIDLNKDYDFDDPGEFVYYVTNVQDTHLANFTIPEDTPLGSTRMRIINTEYSAKSEGTFFNGETEDYTVNITDEGCFTYNSFPYNEGFENGVRFWMQVNNDSIDWRLNSDGTPSNDTGPSNAKEGSNYLYIEATGNTPSNVAQLRSPCLDLSSLTNPIISFGYHMYGSNMGTLTLQISIENSNNWLDIWSESGDKGDIWKTASVDLSSYKKQTVRFQFSGTTGSGFRSDMAIDELAINESSVNSDCQGVNENIGTGVISSRHYAVSENITAACQINAPTEVIFQAGSSVTLSPGFKANIGSSFWAKIEDCTINNSIKSITSKLNTSKEVYPLTSGLVELKLYPNPARQSTSLLVKNLEKGLLTIKIISMTGQILKNVQPPIVLPKGVYTYEITTDDLTEGIYLISGKIGKQFFNKKLIVVQ